MKNTKLVDFVNNGGFETLEEKFPTLNAGGCGVFALLLGKELESRGLAVKVNCVASIWGSTIDCTEQELTAMIAENRTRAIPNAHITLSCENLTFDSNGANDRGIVCKTSLQVLTDMLNCDCWNSDFDRAEIMPKLAAEIKQVCQEVQPEKQNDLFLH